jgi:hypothetical protein
VNAYAKFRRYNKDFHTHANATGIKGDGSVLFDSALRVTSTKEKKPKRYTKTLADGDAMYLYGGRKALVREFTGFKRAFGDFVLRPPDGYWLSVYHDKVIVDRNKTKRILMITSFRTTSYPSSDISGRRLKVPLFEYQIPAHGNSNAGFYTNLDLAGLERIVRAIPD